VEHGSGSEEDLPAVKSDRFKALVERKRQERLAREAAEEARKAERRAEQEKLASELEQLASDEGNVSDITDDEAGRKLTQDARPTRKASKRAIEEMSRETQRMARNMQLAHEAKTRKKISKHSLFERFNYRPAGETAPPATSSSRPATPPTDAEMKDAETPPSSPPMAPKDLSKETVEGTETTAEIVDNDDSPSVETLLTTKIDKGKGKEVLPQVSDKPALQPKRQVRVKFPQPMVNHVTIDPFRVEDILGRERDSVERTDRFATGERRVRRFRFRQRPLASHLDGRVDGRVDGRDPVQKGAGDFH
jgi:mediator of replication checkpoint protein 1